MVLYKIHFKSSTDRELKSIPKADQIKIFKQIYALATNPRPPGCLKLTEQNRYRVRHGDYRIIYEILDDRLIIQVVKVGHRKDIYRVSEKQANYQAAKE